MPSYHRHVIARGGAWQTRQYIASNAQAYSQHVKPVIEWLRHTFGIPAVSIQYRYDERPISAQQNDLEELVAKCYPAGDDPSSLRLIVLPAGELTNPEAVPASPLIGIIRRQEGGHTWLANPPAHCNFEVISPPQAVQHIIADTLLDIAVANSHFIRPVLDRYAITHGRASLYALKLSFMKNAGLATSFGSLTGSEGYVPLAAAARVLSGASHAGMAGQVADLWHRFICERLTDFLPLREEAHELLTHYSPLKSLISDKQASAVIDQTNADGTALAIRSVSPIRNNPKIEADYKAIYGPRSAPGSWTIVRTNELYKEGPLRRLASRNHVKIVRFFIGRK